MNVEAKEDLMEEVGVPHPLDDLDEALTLEERHADLDFIRARTDQIKLENEKLSIELNDTKAGPDEAQIYPLFGEMEPLSVARFIQTSSLWSRRAPGSDITLLLSSPGGDVISGLALYDHIMHLRNKGHVVTIKVMSMAASMAAVILQAASTRVMGPSALLMLHEGSIGFAGTVAGLQDNMKAIDLMNGRCKTAITERSGMTPQKYSRLIKRKDYWMDAEEALGLGLVDKVEA